MALEPLAVWSIPPNWQGGMMHTVEFMTSVTESPLAVEQRMGLRLSPRHFYEYGFLVEGPVRTLFDMLVIRGGGSALYVPLFYEVELLGLAAPAGSTGLDVSPDDTEFENVNAVFIAGPTPFQYEIAEIDSISSLSIGLAAPLAYTWPAGTRVYPLKKCKFDGQPSTQHVTDRTLTARVRFQSLETNKGSFDVVPPPAWRPFILDTPPGAESIHPQDLSADGRYAVGYAVISGNNWVGCIWDLSDFSVRVEPSPFPPSFTDFYALYGVNGDGSVYCGYVLDPTSGEQRGGYWKDRVFTELDPIPPADPCAAPYSLSINGTMAVGGAPEAVYWDLRDGNTLPGPQLPVIAGFRAVVLGISDNERVITGTGRTTSIHSVAVKWIDGAVNQLPDLPGGLGSDAVYISNDGSVVVGRARDSSNHPWPVYWPNTSTIVTLPGGEGSASDIAIIGATKKIVGNLSSGFPVVWVNDVIEQVLPGPDGDSAQGFAIRISSAGTVAIGEMLVGGVYRGTAWKYF